MPLLLPADEAVARRDAALPGLAVLLDPERLRTAIERATGHRGLAQPLVHYLRYKPGQSCLAACRLEINGRPVECYASVYRPGAHDKVRKAFARPSVHGPLGSGRFFLEQDAILVSVFPNDTKLEPLARLVSPDVLAQLVRHAHTAAPGTTGVRIDTLRYNPQRRFVGTLRVGSRQVATVRCYAQAEYLPTAAKAGVLSSGGPLHIARNLARLDRHRLLAFEWLSGELLDDALTKEAAAADALALVGAALAEVHSQAAPTLPLRSGESEAAAMLAMAHDLGVICPDLATRAADLANRLAARLANDSTSRCAIHGDFYAKQVLLQGRTAALLDLDHASRGDPAVDLSRFCADLEARVIAGHLDPNRVETSVGQLFEGYCAAGAELPAHIDRHIAAQLLRLTLHPFRLRQPMWPQLSAALVERAEAFLEREVGSREMGLSGPAMVERSAVPRHAAHSCSAQDPPLPRAVRATVVDPFGVVSDPAMPFLASALDRHRIAEQFRGQLTCLDPDERPDVVGISVMRYKPGRRCLVSYDLAPSGRHGGAGHLALVGKVRARGIDTSTHRLLSRLATSGFGPDADDGISVPEPVGVVAGAHMVVQRRVPGESLGSLLEGSRGYALARRAAEAIEKLHRLSVPADRQHSIGDEIRILRERVARVAESHAEWRIRISALLDGCARIAAGLETAPASGIHRDFYPDQILIDGDRLYLLDLDLYSNGDPALDVGNFLAHIDEYSLRRFGDPAYLADRKEAIVERYLELSGRTTRAAINAYAALSLTRHVAISRQFADRRAFTGALLELCEQRVLRQSHLGRE